MANRPKMSSPTRAQTAAVTPSRARSTAVLAAPPPMFKHQLVDRDQLAGPGQVVERRAEMVGHHQPGADDGDRGRGRRGELDTAAAPQCGQQERARRGSTFRQRLGTACSVRSASSVTTDCRSRRRSRRLAVVLRPSRIVGRPLADQLFDLGDGQDLALDQGLGQAFQLVAVLFEDAVGAVVGLAEDAADFLVDELGGVLGVVAGLAHLAAEERMFLGGAEEDRADALAHAALGDHQPGQPGRLLQVVGGAR